ncbi:MAG: twin-arginine translocase TatA/TatE family subunit [Calditrichae bacterium]|nr:twin-arginine translocase TatA/TatE family subunit [Calditrichia bacterium]NIW78220.1 twin-arginine translocase TatA/TatE family subunit [Calditrichia bacterium]
MPFNMGPAELIIVFLIVILLFGAKRLPDLARSLGRSIKEFKHATQGLKDEFDMDKIEESPKSRSSQQQSNNEVHTKQEQSQQKETKEQ